MANVELLAPAGSLDILKAAILCGADAVYIGGKNFGARAYAQNFNHDEIIEGVNFAHHYGARVYVTMNTLLNEYELEAALKEVDFLYHAKVDALLIQDYGLYYEVSKAYPDFELHASTQMHIHNLKGVKSLQKLGFKRVVLARETSLELISEACKQDIDIEVFVHGAICVSYSGQCLMSSAMFKRSGNKGMCAQCCRLPYKLYDEDRKSFLDSDQPYFLSPRDMNLLHHIPELINAGVRSLKIEGRMKKKAYVCYVTSLYRAAIDAYYEGKAFQYTEAMDHQLHSLFQRNFTDAYLTNNPDTPFFASKHPNHQGTKLGEVVAFKGHSAYIKLADSLAQFDGIRFLNGHDDGLMINYLYLDDKLINQAKAGDIVRVDIPFKVKVHDSVIKTSDYHFEASFDHLDNRHTLGLKLEVIAKIGDHLKIKGHYKDLNIQVESLEILEKATKLKAQKEDIYRQLNKLNDTPYYIEDITYNLDDVFIPNKILNNLRRELIAKMDALRASSFKRFNNIYAFSYRPLNKGLNAKLIQRASYIYADKQKYHRLPVINPASHYLDDNYLTVSEAGGIFLNAEHKIAYYTLNITNSSALAFFRRLGFEAVILSTELNDNELAALLKNYHDKYNDDYCPHILKKGKRTLMYLHMDPFKNWENHHLSLIFKKDKFNIFRKDITEIRESKDYYRENKYFQDLEILDD